MLIRGRLLTDPTRPAQPGWLRIEGATIADLAPGDTPQALGTPDLGTDTRIVTPAFFDAHFHFPQIDSIGCDGMPLLEWLDKVVFPAETWWGRGAASAMALTAARRLIREGTAGVAGYLTSDARASAEAARLLASRTPLRLLVGRVAMDREAPDELTAEDRARADSRHNTSPLLPSFGEPPNHRVSINPRFAIACSDELLAECGWAVRDDPSLVVQTHLAETREECARVRDLFRVEHHYTAVYDRAGLLTPNTLLAHCIHLSDDEWKLIAERRSIAVHCPTANTFLQAGLFNYDTARAHAVRVALGSDVAGGPDIAMPRVARAMIEVAKARAMTSPTPDLVHVPTPAEVWDIITRRNAELMGWPDAGRLEAGAAASLLVLRVPESWLDEHLVGRLIYNWSPDLIEARIFDGRPVELSTI